MKVTLFAVCGLLAVFASLANGAKLSSTYTESINNEVFTASSDSNLGKEPGQMVLDIYDVYSPCIKVEAVIKYEDTDEKNPRVFAINGRQVDELEMTAMSMDNQVECGKQPDSNESRPHKIDAHVIILFFVIIAAVVV